MFKKLILIAILLYPVIWGLNLVNLGLVLLSLIVVFYITVSFPNVKQLTNSRYTFMLAYVCICAFLLFSFFFERTRSWDGHLWYLKHTLFLTKDSFPAYLEFPWQPFFGELLFAILAKFTTFNFVTLVLGALVLLCAYFINRFYTLLSVPHSIRVVSLLIMLGSPVFIYLGMFEFKVDALLLLFSLFAYMSFVHSIRVPSSRYNILLGFFCAVGVLTKPTFIPIAVFLLLIQFLDAVFISRYKQATVLLGPIVFICILLFWIYVFGVSIPWTTFSIDSAFIKPGVRLTRDPTLYATCLSYVQKMDFNQYFYNDTLRRIVLQPIYNLFWIYPEKPMHVFNMIQPGPFVYISVWLFPICVTFAKRFRKAREEFYLIVITFLFLLFYFIKVRTLYWYLMPVMPLTVLYLVKMFLESGSFVIRKLFVASVLSFCVVYLLLAGIALNKMFREPTFGLGLAISSTQLSYVLDKLPKERYIMDTTPHPYHLYTTYISDYDKRVLRDTYYFYSSGMDIDFMYKELVSNNVGYVTYFTQRKSNSAFNYSGCMRENQDKLKILLDKYGRELYYLDNYGSVYELR